ncbi:MAG: type II secretion system F family protein [Gaiellaceae bacterium]
MIQWRIGLVALAALAVAAPAAAAGRVVDVDLSGYPELRVTVVSPGARPVLEENGVPLAGVRATSLARAKSVVLAVDRSGSMAGTALADATAAARAFVAATSGADRIQVIAFGHRAYALTRFSSSTADAGAALAGLARDPVIGTALWDAVVLAAQGLAREDRPGRAIVVVTDGRDVSSRASPAQAIAAARRAGAAVHAIGIAGAGFSPAPLRELAARTGGSYRQTSSSGRLAAVYAEIARTLAGTWELRYSTSARPGDELRLTAGGAERAVRIPGAAPTTSRPSAAWRSSLAPLAVAGLVGLLVLLACGFAVTAGSGMWLRARLQPHLGPPPGARSPRRRERGAFPRRVFATTERTLANVKQFRALQRLLARADLPLLAAELLYVALGCGIAFGFLAALATPPPLFVLASMAAGAALPFLFALVKARARMRAFDGQLPDLLITLAATLKAGHSFEQALQAVVDDGAEPAAGEFRRVLTETRLGRPLGDALAAMASRIGSKNFTFVITAVTIQRQIGGSLAELFDLVAETVRQRHQFARKVRGLTAMGRMSAYVLTGLPFFIALAVTALNPAYMAPLYGTPTGQRLIVLGLVLMTTGTVILRRIVSFRG